MIQRAFYALASFCALFAINQIKDLSQSVESLNKNMAVLILQMNTTQTQMQDHEVRLRIIEQHKFR